MAKIKVHELAKELELQSKDILNFLQEKGIEAKAAQSSLEEDAAALVRNSLGQKKATAAPAVEKEAPAKAENTKPVEEKAQEETKSPEETKKKRGPPKAPVKREKNQPIPKNSCFLQGRNL